MRRAIRWRHGRRRARPRGRHRRRPRGRGGHGRLRRRHAGTWRPRSGRACTRAAPVSRMFLSTSCPWWFCSLWHVQCGMRTHSSQRQHCLWSVAQRHEQVLAAEFAIHVQGTRWQARGDIRTWPACAGLGAACASDHKQHACVTSEKSLEKILALQAHRRAPQPCTTPRSAAARRRPSTARRPARCARRRPRAARRTPRRPAPPPRRPDAQRAPRARSP